MTNFHGFHTHRRVISFTIVLFLYLSGFTADGRKEVVDDEKVLLMELVSSRDEMVEIAGYGEEKLSTVVVTGSLLCEACLEADQPQLRAWPLSGALVRVQCHENKRKRKSMWVHGVTDEFGEFSIDLPSSLHATPNLEKSCSFKILRIPKNTHCKPAFVSKERLMTLSSNENGIRVYSVGNVRFLHRTSKPLEACMKKTAS